MKCPKCGKEMRICAHLGDEPLHEVLGECKDCDLNATWFVRVDTDNRILSETDFKLFRFCQLLELDFFEKFWYNKCGTKIKANRNKKQTKMLNKNFLTEEKLKTNPLSGQFFN